MLVTCPTCQTEIEWCDRYPHRPFCSERCKLIDLGAWASESYRIPSEPVDEWSEQKAPSDSSEHSNPNYPIH